MNPSDEIRALTCHCGRIACRHHTGIPAGYVVDRPHPQPRNPIGKSGGSMTPEELLDLYRGIPKARPLWLAISKVLEIHQPSDEWPISGERDCIECNRADMEGLTPTWWPCPTVEAIRHELEKGSKG